MITLWISRYQCCVGTCVSAAKCLGKKVQCYCPSYVRLGPLGRSGKSTRYIWCYRAFHPDVTFPLALISRSEISHLETWQEIMTIMTAPASFVFYFFWLYMLSHVFGSCRPSDLLLEMPCSSNHFLNSPWSITLILVFVKLSILHSEG